MLDKPEILKTQGEFKKIVDAFKGSECMGERFPDEFLNDIKVSIHFIGSAMEHEGYLRYEDANGFTSEAMIENFQQIAFSNDYQQKVIRVGDALKEMVRSMGNYFFDLFFRDRKEFIDTMKA